MALKIIDKEMWTTSTEKERYAHMTIKVLQREVEPLKSRLGPAGSMIDSYAHLRTTIKVLEKRITEWKII